jgi:CHRD domain
VVVPLKQPGKGDPGTSAQCVRVSRGQAGALNANPDSFYVNVHTAALPNGAVRGQLFARSR